MKIYNEMLERNVKPDYFTFNSLIASCSKPCPRRPEQALRFLKDMVAADAPFNAYTLDSTMRAFIRHSIWVQCLDLIPYFAANGIEPTGFSLTNAVRAMAVGGRTWEACTLLDPWIEKELGEQPVLREGAAGAVEDPSELYSADPRPVERVVEGDFGRADEVVERTRRIMRHACDNLGVVPRRTSLLHASNACQMASRRSSSDLLVPAAKQAARIARLNRHLYPADADRRVLATAIRLCKKADLAQEAEDLDTLYAATARDRSRTPGRMERYTPSMAQVLGVSYYCNYCHAKGHVAKDCPKKKKKIERRKRERDQ